MAKSWSSMSTNEKIEAIKDHSNANLERIAKLEKDAADLKLKIASLSNKTDLLIIDRHKASKA